MILVRLRSLNPALPPVSMATAAVAAAGSVLRGALQLNLLRPRGLAEALGDTGPALRPALSPGLSTSLGLDSTLWTLDTHWYLEEALLSALTRPRLIGPESGPPVAGSEPARTHVNLDRSRTRPEPGLSVFALFSVSEETAEGALFSRA